MVGGRQPVVEDRKNLHYTDAVIHECQRLASVAPIGVPRKTTCDVHLNGYFIKKVRIKQLTQEHFICACIILKFKRMNGLKNEQDEFGHPWFWIDRDDMKYF